MSVFYPLRRLIRLIFCTVLVSALFPSAYGSGELAAQGFQIFNDRNHPWIDWNVSETDHFRIIYPDHLSEIDVWVASAAEESYRVLSERLGIEFERKVRIYLSDEDEINNGFAVPIGDGHTNIWVGVNDYAETWTGQEKWIRKVIAHELAHIAHFQATDTGLGLLNYLISDPVPRFWTEGLAQYLTEQWDSQRGDRWLRLAIFDDRPDYRNRDWLYNSRLLYAVGHSQVRYLAHSRGDSLLPAILSHRDSFGPFRTHDFGRSFEAVAGEPWEEFEEEWRKHMNIYYNTLASRMERTDSLAAEPESLPGRYYLDASWSPDQKIIAVLSIPSIQRPQRQLHLVENDSLRGSRVIADGAIRPELTWRPDGKQLAYSRKNRDQRGSLVNDLYLYDLEEDREFRLTNGRRIAYPAWSPDGRRLAAIVNEKGTANILILDLVSGREYYVTDYQGDVQLIHLAWNPVRNELVYHRFGPDGARHLVRRRPDGSGVRLIDPGEGDLDNRHPLISPGGNKIAFTSLRDQVPNLFINDLETGRTERATHLFTGGEGLDWIRDVEGEDKIAIRSGESKSREEIYLIPVTRRVEPVRPDLPEAYAGWKTHSPPEQIPSRVEPDTSLIRTRGTYNTWNEITHVTSFGLPWIAGRDSYGLAGFSSWVEPLGKHGIAAGGILSAANPGESAGFVSYLNNQFYPSALLSLFRGPIPLRTYGGEYLIERRTGLDLTLQWPLNGLEAPFRDSWIITGVRVDNRDPWFYRGRTPEPPLTLPGSGTGISFQIGWTLREQKPFYRNLLHPLDGYGVRINIKGRESLSGDGSASLTGDLHSYLTLPAFANHRLMLLARVQNQWGSPLVQDRLGFSRRDEIQLPLPPGLRSVYGVGRDRVRGYRDFMLTDRLLFLSAEYRIPLLPSLQTEILGLLRLGATSFAVFGDAGLTGPLYMADTMQPERRMLGFGSEIKNMMTVGPINLIHSVGLAQPHVDLFSREMEIYYRIRASVPF